MTQTHRKPWFIDGRVQGRLVILFLFIEVVCFAIIFVAFDIFSNEIKDLVVPRYPQLSIDELLQPSSYMFLKALFGAVLLQSLFIVFLSIYYSNRFIGPIQRLHTALNRLSAGEKTTPIALRKKDFLQEVMERFNHALSFLDERRRLMFSEIDLLVEQGKISQSEAQTIKSHIKDVETGDRETSFTSSDA